MSNIEIYKDSCLKKYCTFKIGGNADFIFVCHNRSSLISVCKHCKENNIKFKVIGFGANLLFDDSGYNGAIIVNKSNKIFIKENSVFAESGVSVGSLINQCASKNLGGIEQLAGIPSTIGGAIVNNLGAFGCEIGNFVDYVEVLDMSNLDKILKLKQEDCKFEYRNSLFKNENYIITKVKLNLVKKDETLIRKLILKYIKQKSSTQPLDKPSAGSIFKRTSIIPAKVIDELGLKGTKIGDAEISTKHAGFIVNLGNASSKDVKELISLIQKCVFEKYVEKLTPEIEFIN